MHVEGQKSLGEWKGEVEALLSDSAALQPNALIDALCSLAEAVGCDTAEQLLVAYPELFDHAQSLKMTNFQRIVAMDVTETRRILDLDLDKGARFAEIASTRRMISYNRSRAMFDAIDFDDCERLVMVGCGALPFTMFHVHDRTEVAQIVGLDILPEAIDTARQVSQKLGYPRLSFALHDGRSYDYAKAEIVYIASTVFPKPLVMSRIAETAPAGARIISRDPYSLGKLWVEDSEGHLDRRLEAIGAGEGIRSLTRDVYFRRLPRPQTTTRPP
jgi:hypothetical protein